MENDTITDEIETDEVEIETDEVTEAPPATLTAVELANHLGVSPKSLRRFIRDSDLGCGKGNRYGFALDDAKALIAAFSARPTRTTTARTTDEVAALLADPEDDAEGDDTDA